MTANSPLLTPPDLAATYLGNAAPAGPEGERDRILRVLTECAGNQSRAAKVLGISRSTLIVKLTEHQLPRPRK
jgi:transcriptional regulator of acetoin/glycerol metabolism